MIRQLGLLVLVFALGSHALAEPASSASPARPAAGGLNDELTFDPDAAPEVTESSEGSESSSAATTGSAAKGVEEAQASSPSDLAGLGQLANYEDLAVIQKRFLPKTNRFELFSSLGFILNQAFFLNYMLNMRLGYHIQESYAVELNTQVLGSMEKQVTTDLRSKRNVATKSLVNPNAYYGLDFKWSPIYGKLGFLNNRIVPFDMYYSAGAGLTSTNQGNAPTGHLGLGQIYAINKSWAARWDMSWYFYTIQGGGFTDYHITIGASWFFPGAKYR